MSSLGPLLPGRLPGTLAALRLAQTMAATHRSMTDLQEQLSTGQRFFIPSSDPSAANRTISLQTLLERQTQFRQTVETDESLLSASDSALSTVSDALNQAKALASSSIGATNTASERESLAVQAESLVRQLLNAANTTFRGRQLFSGSQTGGPAFSLLGVNAVRYNGDQLSINSLTDFATSVANNVDGDTAFGGLTTPITRDVNPALTLQTHISDLSGGAGVTLGKISVSLSSGGQTATVDLAGADTLNDVKTRIEGAFTPGSITVSINAAKTGLLLTPAAGTVAVADTAGSHTATDLGIAGSAAATINGTDLNPALTELTTLASLNGGTGIGAVAGNGLRIVNGTTTSTVDLTGAVTVEDLFNRIRQADPSISATINTAHNGLAISSRLSGADFSIGENNGTNATLLGIRTFTATTAVSSLNFGTGAPIGGAERLDVTRRDGTTVYIDLGGSLTVQDVLDKINAVDPGHLVASLATVGNGIQLTDDSGAGALSVANNALGHAFGLAGTQTNAALPLTGTEINPQEVHGSLNLVLRLKDAIARGDNGELTRLGGQIDGEIVDVAQVRGELGGRLKALADARNHLEDGEIAIQQGLSDNFDTDMATVLTQLLTQQASYQAVLQTTAKSLQTTLLSYL